MTSEDIKHQLITFNSWSEFTKCKEAFSKATSIQFCTVASHSVNSANEKVVEGQPKYEEKFKYASEQ